MMAGALDNICRTHRCLICINPAPVPTVSLVSALRIGLERPASTGGWLRDHPELLTQGIKMKLSITLSALLIAGFMAVTTELASAIDIADCR